MPVRTLDAPKEQQLQLKLLEQSEIGTFSVNSKALPDHLEAMRSLFALAQNTTGQKNHIMFAMGDVLQGSSAMFGDEFDQGMDDFAELIHWDSTKITEVVRTSQTFWSSDLRRYGYDPHTWKRIYGEQTPVAENCPLEWNVFDAVSRNVGHLDEKAITILVYILWCQGMSHNQAKAFFKLIHHEDELYTDEIAKIGMMAPTEQFQYIAELKAKHKDTEIRGKYLVYTIEDEPQPNGEVKKVGKISRQVKVDGYVLGKSEMIVFKTAREFNLVTGFDGDKVLSTIIPTGDEFE